MKYIEINRKFTETVRNYLNDGWTVNTSTMSGSQGEVAHIDLTNGAEIIRVLLDTFCDYESGLGGLELVVGAVKYEDKRDGRIAANKPGYGSIWNNRLEVIARERFHKVGESRRGIAVYGTQEEAERAAELRLQRYRYRDVPCRTGLYGDEVQKIAANYLRRKGICKRPNKNRIEVYRYGMGVYAIEYCGKQYKLA